MLSLGLGGVSVVGSGLWMYSSSPSTSRIDTVGSTVLMVNFGSVRAREAVGWVLGWLPGRPVGWSGPGVVPLGGQ